MFFETHHKMGQLMHDRLERLHPGRIQRDAFVYGNVKPDLMRKGAKDRHLLSDTLPFIELTSGFLCTPSMDPEEDSVLLGMVCHHVCDAFCRYHQELGLYRDYPRHLEYELGLNAYFLEWLQGGLRLTDDGRVTDDAGFGADMQPFQALPADAGSLAVEATTVPVGAIQAVVPMMLRLHLRRVAYTAADPGFQLDLVSSLEACADITDGILAIRFSSGRCQQPEGIVTPAV